MERKSGLCGGVRVAVARFRLKRLSR